MRSWLPVLLVLVPAVAGAASRFVDRVNDSLPEGVKISGMTCRGSAVKIRGEAGSNAQLGAFLRALDKRGISAQLDFVMNKKDSDPVMRIFMMHARDTASPQLDPCVGLPGRYSVPGAAVVRGSFRDACPGTPSPRHIHGNQAIDDIRVIGVMSRSGGAREAVVKTEDSELHRVRRGDRLGNEGACVTKVTDGGIAVRISGNPPEVRTIPLTQD